VHLHNIVYQCQARYHDAYQCQVSDDLELTVSSVGAATASSSGCINVHSHDVLCYTTITFFIPAVYIDICIQAVVAVHNVRGGIQALTKQLPSVEGKLCA
jgi:hypothetical protein